MALTEQQWRQIERRSGVPARVIKILVNRGERSGQQSVSPAGNRGRAQLSPSLMRSYRKQGIDTSSEFGNILGGAMYLAQQKRRFKSWRLAFAAYNAGPNAVAKYHGVPPYRETQDYVRRTMQALGAAAPDTHEPGSQSAAQAAVSPGSDPLDLKAIAEQGMADIASGSYDPVGSFASTARAVAAARSEAPVAQEAPGVSGAPAPAQGPWQKYVRLAPDADREGVHTHDEVLQFVGSLGLQLGRRLTIGTGSAHSQMTTTGNVSDHWDGWAADIPLTGKALTRAGQQALIAAGMSPKEARKARGGIYNVGGWQIIFNTKAGGNHWNHLHVGKSH